MTRFIVPGIGILVNRAFRLNGRTYPVGWLQTATSEDLAAINVIPEPNTVTPGMRWDVSNDEWKELPVNPDRAIAQAWSAADALARSGADENGRARYLAWLIDPASSAARKQKIADVMAWMDSVWQQYATVKAANLARIYTEFDASAIAPCPWTFWDIAAA